MAINSGDWRTVRQALAKNRKTISVPYYTHLRGRIAEAAGELRLALSAYGTAMQQESHPFHRFNYLRLLGRIDPQQAVELADLQLANEGHPIEILAAVGVLFESATKLQGAALRSRLSRLVRVIDDLEKRSLIPEEHKAAIWMMVGICHTDLGNLDVAVRYLERVADHITGSPFVRLPLAIARYKAGDIRGIPELETVAASGVDSFWPEYLLAHHAVELDDWAAVKRWATLARKKRTPVGVEANLYEWLAIAAAEEDDYDNAKALFRKAIALAGNEESRIRQNYEMFTAILEGSRPTDSWSIGIDSQPDHAFYNRSIPVPEDEPAKVPA